MSLIKNLLVKPLEWHLILLGMLVYVLFYLQIVLTPTFVIGVLGIIAFDFYDQTTAKYITIAMTGLGLIVGIFWAERIRKTIGIITFHAYLLSTPEIDGWRDTKTK